FLLLSCHPPRLTLFPYTTLFRSGLLGALGRLARFRFRLLLKARAQGLHEVDDLRAGFGRLGQGNLLTFDLLLHRRLDARSHIVRSEEHTSELQSRVDLVCRLLLE